MTTIKELASYIAKLEGKKTQARIGEIREELGILSDAFYEHDDTWALTSLLVNNGYKRAKRKYGKKAQHKSVKPGMID